jgi:hypothetical protein
VVIVGTTIAAIVALLVCSGDNKVSTKDAFTLFENNSGWANSEWFTCSTITVTLTLLRRLGVFVGIHGAYVDADWLYVL